MESTLRLRWENTVSDPRGSRGKIGALVNPQQDSEDGKVEIRKSPSQRRASTKDEFSTVTLVGNDEGRMHRIERLTRPNSRPANDECTEQST